MTFGSSSSDLPPGSWFPRVSTGFAFGGDYSPEQWSEDIWKEDVALMRRAGVNTATVGVFSWGLLEIDDGVFDFGWLDRIIALLHANGIGVILATPTAAPPVWLHRAHPEILPTDERGVRAGQGGRLGWYPSSAVFRSYALRIVERLAERYGTHPAIRLWHVSNELGNENPRDYGDETAVAFRRWLTVRHRRIEELNAAWGTAFWGHRYASFDHIDPPRYTGTGHNPGLLLDFERFSSDALLDHYCAERAVLRRSAPAIPITTNFMIQGGPGVADYARWAREVDVVSNDHYTNAADPERHGELAFSADRTRGVARGRPWLLMEHSASSVNWQPRNRAKRPGELMRDSLAHIARGAEGALFFQWRQSTAGSEQHHSAMLPHAGPNSRVFREIEALGSALSRIAEVAGSSVETAQVAVLLDHAAAQALRSGRNPSVDIDPLAVALALHRELTHRGIAVDVVSPGDDLSPYEVVLVPILYLVAPETARAVEESAARGASVVITWFSGVVDPDNRVIAGGYPGAFRELLGLSTDEFLPLLEDESVVLDTGWTGRVWSERLQTRGATTVASYTTGDLQGSPAVTRNAVGSGAAWYVSTLLDRAAAAVVLDRVLAEARVHPVAEADPGLDMTRRVNGTASWLFAINHGADPLRLASPGFDLLTGETFGGVVAPGTVAVIREDR